MNFLPGDLILTARIGPLDRAIRYFERSRGEEPSRVAHVAGVSYGGNLHQAQIIEALGRGTVERSLVRYATHDVSAAIFRIPGLSDIERARVVSVARGYVGRPYGYLKIILHALGLRKFIKTGTAPICSQIWAEAYAAIGVTFKGVEPRLVQPDDIWDEVQSEPWEAIGVI